MPAWLNLGLTPLISLLPSAWQVITAKETTTPRLVKSGIMASCYEDKLATIRHVFALHAQTILRLRQNLSLQKAQSRQYQWQSPKNTTANTAQQIPPLNKITAVLTVAYCCSYGVLALLWNAGQIL